MNQLLRLFKFALSNFGPLLVFYLANHYVDLRTAIIISVVFSLVEIAYKLLRKEAFTGFFKFSVFITVVFGALDLSIRTPIFFRYESVITNIITGVYFGMTIWSSRSFIQEWIEKKNGVPLTNQNSILRCRMITAVWTAYFFIKAGIYVYVNSHYTVEQAMIFRSTFGTASFYALLAISIVFGSKIIKFFQSRKMLPSYPETETT